MNQFERRLRKVEAAFPAPELVITNEERRVAWLSVLIIMYLNKRSPLRIQIENQCNEIGRDIIETAKYHESDQFSRRLVELDLPMWKLRWGNEKFLPPICGSVGDDWEVDNLYERRIAIRHVPLVVALIGPPDDTLGWPKYIIRWDHVFDAILSKACTSQEISRVLSLALRLLQA